MYFFFFELCFLCNNLIPMEGAKANNYCTACTAQNVAIKMLIQHIQHCCTVLTDAGQDFNDQGPVLLLDGKLQTMSFSILLV